MAEGLPDNLLSSLSEFVTAQMGLHFPPQRWRDLERGIQSAAREFDFEDAAACINWLASSRLTKEQIELLASYLTVGETYFFRERKTFEILEERVLAELIRSRRDSERRLRIWSAGCCTGEEPYSLAILLSKMLPDLADWNVTILATDINARFLRKAESGRYSMWSFRDPPSWLRPAYFSKGSADTLEIVPQVRSMVTLAYLNLADDVYPSLLNNTNAMDLIFCRNVLMYFAPDQARRTVQKLHRCLRDGGWLVVSPSETSRELFSDFSPVNFPGAILYQKAGERLEHIKSIENWPVERPESAFSFPLQTLDELSAHGVVEAGFRSENSSQPEQTPASQPLASSFQGAQALFERGDYAEAEKEILARPIEGSSDPSAMALLARICANQGRLEEAQKWCEKAIAADKVNAGFRYLRANILQERGGLEEAMASLERALYLDPNFVLAHFTLGNLARRQGKAAESLKHFESALRLLSKYRSEQVLAESEGITAGRLTEIITVQRDRREEVQEATSGGGDLASQRRSRLP